MSSVTIYHNPRCSKSRQTLQLLRDQGIEPEVVEYLKNPLAATTIKHLIELLGIEASDLLRQKEYRALALPETTSEAELIEQMAENPKVIERPIVVAGGKARIGRPPESILDILPS